MSEPTCKQRRAALEALGSPSAGGETGYVYETTAADLLGVTAYSLRKLCSTAKRAPNPHRGGAEARLYDPVQLLAVKGCEEHLAAIARRGRKARDYAPTFRRRYMNRDGGLPAAAEALWNLNRYAKHDSCSDDHRDAIYDLKNSFIESLCKRGMLIARGVHTRHQPKRDYDCWTCHGLGCGRCEGTGVHHSLPARDLHFDVMRFEVGDKQYTWHQPDYLVTWKSPDVPTLTGDDWQSEREKPVAMPSRKFAEGKALVRWVLGGSATANASESRSHRRDRDGDTAPSER